MTSPTGRLDQPRDTRRTMRPRVDSDAFGALAEGIARFLGTARFLVIQTVIVIIWIIINAAVIALRWDPYPFILLNLAFSTQAAYAAPLILLAQNRQDDRDRVSLREDRDQAARTRADTEYITRELADLRIAQNEAASRDYLRGELTRQLEQLREEISELLRNDGEPPAPGTDAERERRREKERRARKRERKETVKQ